MLVTLHGVFNIRAKPMGDNIVIAWSNIVQAGVLHMASAWDLITSDMTNTLLPLPPILLWFLWFVAFYSFLSLSRL